MPDLNSWIPVTQYGYEWEYCAEDGTTAFRDEEGNRVLTVPGVMDGTAARAVMAGYLRGLQVGDRAGYARYRAKMRGLLGITD